MKYCKSRRSVLASISIWWSLNGKTWSDAYHIKWLEDLMTINWQRERESEREIERESTCGNQVPAAGLHELITEAPCKYQQNNKEHFISYLSSCSEHPDVPRWNVPLLFINLRYFKYFPITLSTTEIFIRLIRLLHCSVTQYKVRWRQFCLNSPPSEMTNT